MCEAEQRIVIGKGATKGVGRVFLKANLKPDRSFFTASCNLPIQDICADIAMQALAYVDERLWAAKISGGPVAWLHDEIVMEVCADRAEEAARLLEGAMIDAFAEHLPGAPVSDLVEARSGSSRGEAKKAKN
jgi:DNA polymerase I-like protein with 3'-5' exonuclease and polymerase domains